MCSYIVIMIEIVGLSASYFYQVVFFISTFGLSVRRYVRNNLFRIYPSLAGFTYITFLTVLSTKLADCKMTRSYVCFNRMTKPLILVLFLICAFSVQAFSKNQSVLADRASITNSDNQRLSISFKLSDVQRDELVTNGVTQYNFSLSDEAYIMADGRPKLPAVSRTVVVPPGSGLEFVFTSDEPRVENAENPPVLFTFDSQSVDLLRDAPPLREVYPAVIAEMSEPFIIRGVRLVRVTTYPVRYDPQAGTYLYYDNIETELRFTNDEPVNPVHNPIRRNRTEEFLKFIEAYALNGSDVRRDDPERDQVDRKPGHYLIVSHEACLEYVAPFIEWRRKGGYKVEILTFNQDEARNSNTVLAGIQWRYDAYIDQEIDPFDHILLVGDRARYDGNGPDAQWILGAPTGQSSWPNPGHADYLYACLEGNDEHMDAAISRFPAGNPATLNLVVGRTLSYETEPYMEDPAWFTRGAVFSQHSGHAPNSSWSPYLHTIVRWGEEVLKKKGFDDIAIYENMEWDGRGEQIHPFLRDIYNEGGNVFVGLAQSYQWRNEFQGVNDNVIFPITLNASQHTDFAGYVSFRTGDGDHLKGPVAATCTPGEYGDLVPVCVQWAGLVSAFINHDLTLGWSRVYAVTDLESYFPNVDVGRDLLLYQQAKTDFDFLGDPGIQAWIGVPQLVEAQLSVEVVSPMTSYVEVIVTEEENGEPVAGANVSIYAPGDSPNFNDAEYADYDPMLQLISVSDEDGRAEFYFDDENEFTPDTRFFYTVTGRNIRPFFDEVNITESPVAIEVANFEFEEVDGNGDDELNPGESFALRFTAANISEEENLNGVIAIVNSNSEWIEVDDNEIDLGDIEAGGEVVFEQGVNFVLTEDCPDGVQFPDECPLLQVEFTSGDVTWESAVEIDPVAPAFVVSEIVGGNQIPFDIETLNIEIENVGRMEAGALTAELHSGGRSILIAGNESVYPNIAVGEQARLENDLFQLSVNQQTIPGVNTDLMLTLTAENGFTQQIPFTVQMEDGEGNFPQPPDDYGYICFDDTDEDWVMAPDYEWIEISLGENDRDFNGELLDFAGESEFDIGESIVVNLPFETHFYGEDFEQITVCTKGFIAMGNQPRITNYQPSPLDRAMGGGTGMIAPFWGDLDFTENTGIYTFYDEENARFIIEWYGMTHLTQRGDVLTFQVIIYDPEVWIFQLGDSKILFQYRSISDLRNIRSNNEWLRSIPFAAIGISSPDGTTGINYSFNNTLPPSSAPLEDGRAILFSTGFELRLGRLFGTVTDFETGESIEDAQIYTLHGFSALTDNEGDWEIPGALAEIPFSLACSAPGYNDSTLFELFVEEGEDLEINFELLHPEFSPSVEELEAVLQEGDAIELPFEISNTGNGPLTWRAEERLRGDANAEPWDLRRSYSIGETLDDPRCQGVVWVEDHFYVAGSNSRDPQIYILNREGELVDQYDQFGGDGGYGHKDLAFDGEWIWGSGAGIIYAFTLEGELMREFEGPFNPNNNLAWDVDRELLWVSSTTSNFIAIDREGNEIAELNRRGMRIYGLGYWPDDPDGYPLYIFQKDREIADQIITKMNPDDNDTLFVKVLQPPDGGTPSGAFCTNQFDVYSWVFMGISNNGPNDRLDLWQIDARREWFDLDIIDGMLNPDETQDLVLTLDATGLPEGITFEAELRFYHNATGGVFNILVGLEVLEGDPSIELELLEGWNLISINVEPENLDVRELLGTLTDEDKVIIFKNGIGQFYLPERNFCNIEGWDISDGYQIKMTEASVWEVRGAPVPADRPISLEAGWNMKAYFPTQPIDAIVALAGIADNLIIAKDWFGRFYLPEFGFNNLGNLQAGQGYQYNVHEADELIYQFREQVALLGSETSQPKHFEVLTPTGTDMSILLTGNPQISGMEIGIFTSGGRLVGSGVFNPDGNCGVAVWGDDATTDVVDGSGAGEVLNFVLWDGTEERKINPEFVSGEPNWTDGGFLMAKISSVSEAPVTFGIHESYPNPTNGPVKLSFGVEIDGMVSLSVYDLSGRLVTSLVSGEYKTGNYQVIWNTDFVSSGLYLVKLAVPNRSQTKKIAVLK
jgi:hypothetical protein